MEEDTKEFGKFIIEYLKANMKQDLWGSIIFRMAKNLIIQGQVIAHPVLSIDEAVSKILSSVLVSLPQEGRWGAAAARAGERSEKQVSWGMAEGTRII